MNIYSILDENDPKFLLDEIENSLYDNKINKSIGSIMGLTFGDCIGAPMEFMEASDGSKILDITNYIYREENNVFNLKRGQWSDDTSMSLCIADSLIIHKCFNPVDIRIRFWNWWENGYNNSFRLDTERDYSVGLGSNISESIYSIKTGSIPTAYYECKNENSGNGSLMRLCPIVIYYNTNLNKCIEYCKLSSKITHSGKIAEECCGFFGYLLYNAIQNKVTNASVFLNKYTQKYLKLLKNKEEKSVRELIKLINGNEDENSTEYCWNWRDKNINIKQTLKNRGKYYNGFEVNSRYFGSYCLDGLAICLWAIYNSDSFLSSIEKAVNLCGDADTTGSITGQLSGAIYGYKSFKTHKLIEEIKKWDENHIATRGLLLGLVI